LPAPLSFFQKRRFPNGLTGNYQYGLPLRLLGRYFQAANQKGRSLRFVPFAGAVMRITDRPWCPTCKHPMGLAQISVGERGFEARTFECSTCHLIEKIAFPVDPMKTDAVGWLASELTPLGLPATISN
jgi:hypothetical protein